MMSNEENVKLDLLIDEISEGIRNLSKLPKKALNNIITQLKEASKNDQYPKVTLSILLFRKYANIANEIEETLKATASSPNSNSASGVYLSSDSGLSPLFDATSNTGIDVRLIGWGAMRSRLFWYRVGNIILISIYIYLQYFMLHITIIYSNCYVFIHFFRDFIDGFKY